MKKSLLFLLGVLCSCLFALGQKPNLVKNINPTVVDPYSHSDPMNGNNPNYPDTGIFIRGRMYFPANTYNGIELWMTNGTAAGTNIVKDIVSGYYNSDASPMFPHVVGTQLYFFTADWDYTNNRQNNFRLYNMDTATQAIPGGSLTDNPFDYVGKVVATPTDIYFIGYNSNTSSSYHTADTALIKYTPASNSYKVVSTARPHELYVLNNAYVYFDGDDRSGAGRQLWVYDIANDNPYIAQADNQKGNSNPHDFVGLGNTLYYTADDGSGSGRQLKWNDIPDGSGGGVVFGLGDCNPMSKIAYANRIYFRVTDTANISYDVYYFDPVTQGVNFVQTDYNAFNSRMAIANGLLFFAADDGIVSNELFQTDGTNVQNTMDINPNGESDPDNFTVAGNKLFFVANDGSGPQVWSTNGTTTQRNAIQAANNYTPPRIFGADSSGVYVFADDGVHGREPWRTDGTTTVLVRDVNVGNYYTIGSNVGGMDVYKGRMYFGGYDGNNTNLYAADSLGSNATVVYPGAPNGFQANYYDPSMIRATSSYLFLAANTNATGLELWRSDGTTGGTTMVMDINPGANSSNPTNMVAFGSKIIFLADDGVHGQELWISDGTAAGTMMLKDIVPGGGAPSISNLVAGNGRVFFSANDGVHGAELWTSDGTPQGTLMVMDINPGTADGAPHNFSVINGKLYFTAMQPATGMEPWVSDGTPAGTAILKDINPGAGSSNAGEYTLLGSYVYFAADSLGIQNSIWRTDGTAAGTHFWNATQFPFEFTSLGNRIAFLCFPTNTGRQLLGFEWWVTDGTQTGTQKLTDFSPNGLGSVFIVTWPTHKGHEFITVDDGLHGTELWQTDGTPTGTFITDIAPGHLSSYPGFQKGLGPFFFSADDGTNVGDELYSLAVSGSVTWINFTANKIDTQKVKLQWQTANEINNKGFYIQRSVDNIKFDSLGFVAAGSPGGATYSFTDTAAKVGHNYYRLKQVDQGGVVSYSNTEDVLIILPLKGGTIKYSDTLCANAVPTLMTDSIAATGGSTGIYTYQWQDSVRGQHWVAVQGAVQLSYQSPALSASTYFRRIVHDGADSAISNIIAKTLRVTGDTSVVGITAWNAYVYGGASEVQTEGSAPYYGYYTTAAAVNYSTTTDFPGVGNPSQAANYQGCPLTVGVYPSYTLELKRKGFAPGNYVLNFTFFNDQLGVYVNHKQVYYSGGASSNLIVSLGALDTSSVVEIRQARNVGTSVASMNFTMYTSPLMPGVVGNYTGPFCNTSVIPQQYSQQPAYGGPAPQNIAYQWQDSTAGAHWANVTTGYGGTTVSYSPPTLPVTTYFRRAATDGVSGTVYSDTLTDSIFIPTQTPVVTTIGRVLGTTPQNGVYGYQWLLNGSPISGATGQTYTAVTAGTYTCEFLTGCSYGPVSNAVSFATNAVSQSINFPQPMNIYYGLGAVVTLVATATSNLPVHYTVSGPAIVSQDSVYITGTGTVYVTVNQPGDGTYLPATQVTLSFTVNPGLSTINFPAVGNKKAGDTAMLAATASSGLPVSYTIVSGPATLNGNILTVTGGGTIAVKASQGGNSNYGAAPDVSISFCAGVRQLSVLTGDSAVCPGTGNYAVTALPGVQYTWAVSGGGTITSNGDSASVAWTTPGTYVVSVTAVSGCDATVSAPSTMTVRVASVLVPGAVTNMLPADGSTGQQLPMNLSWIPGQYNSSYDLYIWRSDSSQPATPYASGLKGVVFTVPNSGFTYNKTYNWRIVSHSTCSTTPGPVQSFSLIPLPDLAVTMVQVPATAFSGQPIAISWTVANNGPGNTTTNQRWTDAVFLSFDTLPNFTVPPQVGGSAWNQFSLPVRPLLVGAAPNVSALNAGGSYTNTMSFTLPPNYSWPIYAYVITNYSPGSNAPQEMTLANDTARAPAPVAVTLTPAPDLRVDTVLTPQTTFSGSTINVTFKVRNYGANTPSGSAWYDKVYLSTSALFDINSAIPLNAPKVNGTFYNNPPLAVYGNNGVLQTDSAYTVSASVVIPNFIQGNYFIYVMTDAGNTVYEGAAENNNVGANGVQIFLTPTPLLTVSAVTLPVTTVSTTQPVGLNYTVVNNGFNDNLQKNQGHYLEKLSHCGTCYVPYCAPPTNLCNGCTFQCPAPQPGWTVKDSLGFGDSHWQEKIYLSTDSVSLDVNSALYLGMVQHGPTDGNDYDGKTSVPQIGNGIPDGLNPTVYNINTDVVLNPAASFPASFSFNMPDYLAPGKYYVYVLTNADNGVFEYPAQNQYRRSGALTVQRPDLAVSSVTVPATSMGGQTIQLSYTLVNNGPGAVFGHSRKDQLYLSTSAVFDANAQPVGNPSYTEDLPVGLPLTHTVGVTLPASATGKYYFYVFVNVDSSIRETTMANDNNGHDVSGTNVSTVSPAKTPSFTGASINMPATVPTATGFTFRYTVPNNGVAATGGNWTDSIFVSCSPSYSQGGAYFVGLRRHSDVVAPGGSYTDSFTLVTPMTFDISSCFSTTSGPAYFYVKVDADAGLYLGPGVNPPVVTSGLKTLYNPLVDLTVTNITAMDTLTVGRYYTAAWQVTNLGSNPGSNYYYYWTDGAFLSPDSTFDANVVLAGNQGEFNGVNTSQGYTASSSSFVVPNVPAGDYYFFIGTNIQHQIRGELNFANNNSLWRNADGSAHKVHVIAPALPDLVDTVLSNPGAVALGQPMTISYTVTNNGPGATYPATWSDDMWLSADYIPGNAGDIYLGARNHVGALNPGASYTDSIPATIAQTVPPGNYVLIVRTNAANGVFETNTNNNLAFRYVTIFAPAPSDLTVVNIMHPDTAWLGLPDTTVYTLSNISANPANGTETDGVYLSRTTVPDSSSVLLGTVVNKLKLLPLSLDTVTMTAPVLNVPEGSYYVAVKADLLNNMVETNKTNNLGVAVKQLYVRVKQLPLTSPTANVPTATSLFTLPVYYKLIIPDSLKGATVLITLKSNDSLSANNQLYVGFGYVPTAAKFDYAFGTPNSGNQQILIPSVTNGVYYITTNCVTPAPPNQSITLSAVNLPFSIVSVDANSGGNTGNVTVKLTGSLFQPGMRAELYSQSTGLDLTASAIYFVNSTSIYATFNLRGIATGVYDVRLTRTDSTKTALTRAFTVAPANNGGLITGPATNTGQSGEGDVPGCDPGAQSGMNAQLQTQMVMPAKVFVGWPFIIQINFNNPTNVDIPVQTRVLYSDDGVAVAMSKDSLVNGTTTLYLEFSETNGPPGIIRAGASGTLTIYGQMPLNWIAHKRAHFTLK